MAKKLFIPGVSGNPAGRPRDAKNVKTLLKACQVLAITDRNPVEELVKIADSTDDQELKSDIWKYLHTYCEAPQKEPTKLPSQTPDESVINANKIFADIVNGTQPISIPDSH